MFAMDLSMIKHAVAKLRICTGFALEWTAKHDAAAGGIF
jgi:hypothetical protein